MRKRTRSKRKPKTRGTRNLGASSRRLREKAKGLPGGKLKAIRRAMGS